MQVAVVAVQHLAAQVAQVVLAVAATVARELLRDQPRPLTPEAVVVDRAGLIVGLVLAPAVPASSFFATQSLFRP
jgi:hypothetical protein